LRSRQGNVVRQFISWIRTAPAGERAEATRALARAWLISDLTEDDRAAAEGALLMMLDDASPLVRQAMAQVFARSPEAPAAIVQALSLDQPSIALPILEYSPLLIDADLVDIVATGNCEMQCAIARRINLPASVCAAIAEVGTPAAALELVENAHADLAPFSWDRIAERHGHLAAIRESMLVRTGRPARRDAGRAGRQAVGHAGAIRSHAELVERRSGGPDRQRGARPLDPEYRGALARPRHARSGAAPSRHRPTYCRTDPSRLTIGQSRTVRSRLVGIVRFAASPRLRAAA
jgi:uncharacterized protein (DUF2336 family)